MSGGCSCLAPGSIKIWRCLRQNCRIDRASRLSRRVVYACKAFAPVLFDGQIYTGAGGLFGVGSPGSTSGNTGSLSGEPYASVTLQYAGNNVFVVQALSGTLTPQQCAPDRWINSACTCDEPL